MMKKAIPIILLCALFCCISVNVVSAAVSGSDSTGWKTNEATDDLVLNGNNIHTTADLSNIASGLYADNGSGITLNNGSIITEGFQANGITTTEQSNVIMNGGTIDVGGYMAWGTWVTKGANAELNGVDVTVRGTYALGVILAGEENFSTATFTMNGGSVTMLDTTFYDPPTVGPAGFYISKNSSVALNNVSITTNANGTALSSGASGITVRGSSATYTTSLDMSHVSIKTNGDNSAGLLALGNSKVSSDRTDIVTVGDGSYGVYAYGTSSGSKTQIDISGSTITTTGSDARGMYLIGNSGVSMTGGSISTTSNGADGVFAMGYYTDSGSTAAVSLDNVSITTNGNAADGVYSGYENNGSSYAYLENTSVTTAGSNSHAVNSYRGNVKINGGSLTADDSLDSYAIYAVGTSASTLGMVTGQEALYTINGAIVANNYASIDITMGNGSVLTGRSSVAATGSGLNLAINGANSVWNVTKDSTLSGLTLDGSTVDFSYNNNIGTTITASALNSGAGLTGGNLIMKADIVTETADNLIIGGDTDGTHYIKVLADASAATTGGEITTLVETADQNGTFILSTGTVDSGAWSYSLRQARNVNNSVNTTGTGANWELYASGASNPGSDSVNTFYAAYLLGYAETNTLIQRLGDLRSTPDENGLWFRAHGGKFESNAKSYVKPFDMDYWGVQLGYDKKLNIGWDGDAYAGIMFGYSKGDLEYLSTGKGEVDSKMVGIYGTFIQPNGFYLDAMLKYQWTDNEFNSYDSSGAYVTANDVNTGGFGFLVEVGQRISFNGKPKDGWYAEPQIQLSYQRYDEGYFHASNGLRIGVDGFTSVLGRLGALVGYESEKSNVYAKVFKVKEFDGDVTIWANGVSIPERFDGSWWVYGLGYTAKLNDNNSIYLDIERTSGGSFRQNWAVKAGWRMEF